MSVTAAGKGVQQILLDRAFGVTENALRRIAEHEPQDKAAMIVVKDLKRIARDAIIETHLILTLGG